jgi:hypothetical protein
MATLAGFTQFLQAELLDHIHTDDAYTPAGAGTLWAALSTTTPTEESTSNWNFTEPVGNGYAREPTTAATWDAATTATPSLKTNGAAIDFGSASGGSWGTITHFGIWDNSTVGNLLLGGALSASKTIDDGDSAQFPIGDWDETLN